MQRLMVMKMITTNIVFAKQVKEVCKDQELKQSEPQIQPSKPKRETTYITNSRNTKKNSEQLFSERWPLSNL